VISDPDFTVTALFQVEYLKTACFRDKVTVAHQLETIPNLWNGTMFGDLDSVD